MLRRLAIRPHVSLPQLLTAGEASTPDAANARTVAVTHLVRGRDPRDGSTRLSATTVTAPPAGTAPGALGHVHRQVVLARPAGTTGPVGGAQGIVVGCDCARHMYVWEWVLDQQGAARLTHGNGAPPEQTNPEHRMGLCKHLVAVLRAVAARGL